jgi:hypothetical protein
MSESMSPKSLKIVVVILSLFLIWELVMNNNKQISYDKQLSIKCDSIQHVADSIHNKSYDDEIELNRYQIAFEIFLKRNPKAAEEYGDIISNETE